MRTLAWSFVSLLAAAGCSSSSKISPDAAWPDAAQPDAAQPDATSDACVRDRAAPDGISIDTSEPRLVLINGFPATQLGNTRTIRIYLPPGYADQPERSYPVIYMHDGQNLFDPETATYGHEWKVDETVDSLVAQELIPELIIVGMDSTPGRIDEYTPTRSADPVGPNGEHGGKGALYTAFVVTELKPYIDSHYRTACGPDNTAVIGSSLGGLISFDMGWTHPDVFGKVGAVSPSFWWNQQDTLARLRDIDPLASRPSRIWLDGGSGEENDDRDDDGLIDVIDDMRDVRDQLMVMGYTFGSSLGVREAKGALHNEDAWAERFDDVLLFLVGRDAQPALTELVVDTYGDQVALQGPAPQQALHVNVTARHANGLDMSVPGSLVSFAIDEAIATIEPSGVIRGVATGIATLQATYAGQSSATIDVEVVDAFAQSHRVTFDVTVPATTPADKTVTLAGNVNGWSPRVDSFALQKVDATRWTGTFEFPRGTSVQFKLTLQPQTSDPWSMVEKDANCAEIADRIVVADSDKTYQATVQNWRNNTPCGN